VHLRPASRAGCCRATSCWKHTRGREAGPFDRTIDVQVGRLRKKLEPQAEQSQIIKSVRGAGYILVPSVSRA
jgi:two-component system OmpR family response regulator